MGIKSGGILLDLALIFLLILINAFFAASEIAMVSVNRNKINYLAEDGDKKAQMLLNLIKEPSKFLATIQVGITFAGFLASASAAVSISELVSDILKGTNISFLIKSSEEISLVLVTIVLSFFTLVLGELLPKRLALQNTEKISLFAVKPITFISKVMKPFVFILTATTKFLSKLFGSKTENTEERVTEEEIRMMIHVGEENGVINETEKEMIDGIFKFDDTLAKSVMTPRTDIFAVGVDDLIDDIVDDALELGYSRIPVYEKKLDNIIGILYLKDIFYKMRKSSDVKINLRDILHDVYFIPETKHIDNLFRELQYNKKHMAILIDEYGGVSGLLTMEDLLEEIVGEIYDEYDNETIYIKKIDKNTYLVHGLQSISRVNRELDIALPSDNYDTIGGFVLNQLDSIPKDGEKPVTNFENITFNVEEVKDNRIEIVKIIINS